MKLAALLLTTALAICVAQAPFQRGERRQAPDALKTYLGLTDNQLSAFQTIRESTRTSTEPIREQIREKATALREAVQSGNATAAGQLQVEIQQLREQLAQTLASTRAQMLATLTDDQKAKLASLEAAMELFDEARQATALGLLAGPDGADGPRVGKLGRGPGGRGAKGFAKGGPRAN